MARKVAAELRSLFHRSDADYELDDELRFHIDEKTKLYGARTFAGRKRVARPSSNSAASNA